ncbi:MAG: hypothetical protein LBG96_15830 [Tannerella sp.]|jgi:hypothetical protein|nr:hypothetical protein [Tannerella sp.]
MESKVLSSRVSDMEDRIKKAQALCLEREKLNKTIDALLVPSLTDRALIPVIYEWFAEIVSARNCPADINSAHQRKKFLFIILLLYDPGFFAGMKMASGLRTDLAAILGVKAESTISGNCADILFLYRQYKDFSADIAGIYGQIAERYASSHIREPDASASVGMPGES